MLVVGLFWKDAKYRINLYRIKQTSTTAMVVKTISTLALFIVCFILLIQTSDYARILTSIKLDTYQYPTILNPELVQPIIDGISVADIENDLVELIRELPDDRYYKSENGYQASLYLEKHLNGLISKIASDPVRRLCSVRLFEHEWRQPSVIFKIESPTATSNNGVIIIGCHIDSINFRFYENAPGVDDNLSGVVTVMQSIRHLLRAIENNAIDIHNPIEFHFYSAEEVGSIGSTQVLRRYREENLDVIAMLQQDMTGYTAKTLEKGQPEHFGIITDYVSESLMQFTKAIIDNYCSIPFVETECGKICSDHISALMYGYPSVYVLESTVELSNPYIHSADDTIDKIDFHHVKEHVKLVLAFTAELTINDGVSRLDTDDAMSFKYLDFMILLMMHQTKRFVYAAITFASIVGALYILVADLKNPSSTHPNASDADPHHPGQLLTATPRDRYPNHNPRTKKPFGKSS